MKLYTCKYLLRGFVVQDADGQFWTVPYRRPPWTAWSWEKKRPMPERWKDALVPHDPVWPAWVRELGIPSE